MTLQDALSCGRIVKILVKESYNTFEEASSGNDVRYGVSLRFKNLNGAAKSDVGILLENVKREQSWFIETAEQDSGDVGLTVKWRGLVNSSNTVEVINSLELRTKESLKGDLAVFNTKARIERGRVLDYIHSQDKTDISDLTAEEAERVTLYLEPKKFKDVKNADEEIIGIFHDNVDPLVSNQQGNGISSNAILAALVKTVQELKVLVSQLYAKRVNDMALIQESCIPIVLMIGLGNETLEGTESTSYVITRTKSVLESTENEEIVLDIETVGTAKVVNEDSENEETTDYTLQ